MNPDFHLADSGPRAPVQLVEELPVEPDPELPAPGDLDERRLLRFAEGDPSERPGPFDRVLGSDHAELKEPVVRPCPAEGLDTAEDLADIAHQDARKPALEESPAVHRDGRLRPASAEVPGTGVEIGGAAETVLHPAVGSLDHPGIEPCAGHDREVLAVHRSGVQRAAV